MIKGVAEIELTDVHSGQKEKVVEKNMVTNALKMLFGTPMFGQFPSFLLPVYQNAIGGVLIFDCEIEENPDIVVPPGNAECIGHAGADAYSGENERRGSLNASESMLIDNGFKLVWDFATNQGNGTIQSVCLTSKWGGAKGLGHNNKLEESSYIYGNIYSLSDYSSSYTLLDGDYNYQFDISGEILTIRRRRRPALGVMLKYDYNNRGEELKQQIALSYNGYRYPTPKIMNDKLRFSCVAKGASSTTLYITDISRADLSIVHEESIVFQGVKGDSYSGHMSVFLGDYVYILGEQSVYKCNMKNPADIKEIPFPEGISSVEEMTGPVAGRVLCEEFLIDGNDKAYCIKTNRERYIPINELYGINYYETGVGRYYTELSIFTPYLATINNLASPVVKTADKTMKITYTVTEE